MNNLKQLGFDSYEEYLKSDRWTEIKNWYKQSGLQKSCLVCKNKEYQLHHWDYNNIGHETLGDVIPLCQVCHNKLHIWLKSNKVELKDIVKQFVLCFGFSKQAAYSKLWPFRKIKKGKKPNKYSKKDGRLLPNRHNYVIDKLTGKYNPNIPPN